MPPRQGQRLGYVSALDGLRGIAVLAVVADHYFHISGGAFGVDVFFVLSGFLITSLLLEEHEATGRISFRRFYARRARRLLPALGALFSVLAALYLAFAPALFVRVVLPCFVYASNVMRAFVQQDIPHTPPTVHLWSLAEEEQFYLLWPILLGLVLLRRRRLAQLLGAAFVVALAYRIALVHTGAPWARIYFGPDTRCDGLILGCLVATLRNKGARVPSAIGWPALGGLLTLFALPIARIPSLEYGLPAVEICAALLLLAALEPGLIQRLLSRRLLVWFGLISYSLYLWHIPILWLADGQHQLIALPVAIAVASLSYYGIEQPFRHRRRATHIQPALAHALPRR